MSHINNFNLLRLGAAFGVVLLHLALMLWGEHSALGKTVFSLYAFFPGVPVFFIISGFLISGSFLKRPQVVPYLLNRFLRIWPALALSTCVTAGLMAYFGIGSLSWFINQLSVLFIQHVPATVLPFVGRGGMTPNAALWTIPIEAKFYLLVPFLLWGHAKNHWSRKVTAALTGALMLLSVMVHGLDDMGIKTLGSLRYGAIHHFWFFGWGIMVRLYWHELAPLFKNSLVPALSLHVALVAVMVFGFHAQEVGNPLGQNLTTLALAPTLTWLVMALASTSPGLSNRLLGYTDLSYGIYLFHFPYIVTLSRLGFGAPSAAALVLGLTFTTAWLSWHLLEKRALSLKA